MVRMSLFYAQMCQSNCDKICTKRQFIQKKAIEIILLLSISVKTNAFKGWRCFIVRMSLFYALKCNSLIVTKEAPKDSFI